MKRSIIYIGLLSFILTSCFKEDDRLAPHDPGDLTEAQVAMLQDYSQQLYFDLETNTVVSSNDKDIYDLAFENGPEGWHVLLNTASFMYAAATGTDDFSAPIDTSNYNWRFDPSDGDLSSTAIGRYFSYNPIDSALIYTNEVYVLNRGYDINANLRGLKKVVFEMVGDSTYRIRYANIDGTNEGTYIIDKEDPAISGFAYFSFDEGGKQIYPEPLAKDYDLLFTQYTTLLFTEEGEPYPYLLTGVLVNRQHVETVRDSIVPFDEITYDLAVSMVFTSQLDNIGWDWKVLEGDVTGGGPLVYNIVEGLYFIIRDTDGLLYKLRFTSFYSNQGEKGYPSFEYQRL